MDTGATQGDGPTEGGAAFAGERAASLRRMFPAGHRPVTRAIEPPAPAPAVAPAVAPALGPAVGPAPRPVESRPRRWWLVAAAGVVAVAGAAGAVGFRSAGDRPSDPATTPAGRQPTIAALAPVASISPGPGPSLSPAGPPSRSTSVAPSSRVSTKPAATATSTPRTRPATPPPATSEPKGGPITGYGACDTGERASFTATFTVSYTWRHVFIDSDGDNSTGYRVPTVPGGLGADFMIENGSLYRSTDRSWSWSAVRGSGLQVARTGDKYAWRVSLDALDSEGGLTVVFNGSGDGPEAYTPIVGAGSC